MDEEELGGTGLTNSIFIKCEQLSPLTVLARSKQKSLRPSPSLLPHLTRNLRLTPVRAAALSLAVAEGSEQIEQLRPLARQHFLRTVGEIADALAQGGEQRQEAINVSSG